MDQENEEGQVGKVPTIQGFEVYWNQYADVVIKQADYSGEEHLVIIDKIYISTLIQFLQKARRGPTA